MPGCVAEGESCRGTTTTQSCFPFELEIVTLWVLLNSNTLLLTFYQGEVSLERKRERGEVSRSFSQHPVPTCAVKGQATCFSKWM